MSYDDSYNKVKEYRKRHLDALMGEKKNKWFMSEWDSPSDMLESFKSDDENSEITNYKEDKHVKKIPKHIKLDYVCGLRREVRKQYISEEEDVCTDVTVIRHGMMSTHGAYIFDDALDQVLKKNKD